MKRDNRLIPLLALSLLFLLCGGPAGSASEAGKTRESQVVYVEKISDGDTVEALVNGRKERIRFIGIDAPEMSQRPWGRKAKKFLEELIGGSGWQARIEYDVTRRDQYDRILAYLWGRDGRLINEEMVLGGYAVLYTIPPNVKHAERFKAAQVIARENRRGIWGKNGLTQLPSDYRKAHPRK